MSIFSTPDFDNHEMVAFHTDEKTGLRSIIAIHNTNLGPALGGCRFWNYADEEEALRDVLRLSRGMTYKAALANLSLGGGKAIIFGDSKKNKTSELMQSFGRFVERFKGYYITAEDVGTSPEDMAEIHKTTSYVVGLENLKGGSGDPSLMTAYGVFQGIKACVKEAYGTDSLKGLRIGIQGLGHVGMTLATHLHQEGALLKVYDINEQLAREAGKRFGAEVFSGEDLLTSSLDILSPCALGGVVDDKFLEGFKGKVIAGAANNQLVTAAHGEYLRQKGILYAPDYIINAGGLINVSYEGEFYDVSQVLKHIDTIQETLLEVFRISKEKNIATNRASDILAENKFKHASSSGNSPLLRSNRFLGNPSLPSFQEESPTH